MALTINESCIVFRRLNWTWTNFPALSKFSEFNLHLPMAESKCFSSVNIAANKNNPPVICSKSIPGENLAKLAQAVLIRSFADKKMSFEGVPENLGTLISKDEARRFCVDAMTSIGTIKENAEALADVLIAADYRGHYSHGMNRIEMYVNDMKTKICDANAKPLILKESAATAWVDGKNGLGPVVGNFCMDLAIKKAKETGIGWVVAKGSNHYGIAGWYSMQAADKKMLGMSFTNTSPLMTPTRGKEPMLGTNPLTLAAPAKDDTFVLDMATTAVAVGKIEMQRRKNEPIPVGWAQDTDGHATTDAALAFKASCLMPLGGDELHSGYKGYGLGMLVEIFCGMLAGSHYGPNIRRWMAVNRDADLGQCFAAIDPECFAPGFEDRMSDLIGRCRGSARIDPDVPILIAGDPERGHMKEVDDAGGIRYHINQVKASYKLAMDLGIKPMKSLD